MLLSHPAVAAEPMLNGPVGVTVEQGADGPVTRLVSRWLRPVELWDAAARSNRVYVLEEVSNQLHRFLGEVPRGTMTLALYPLRDMGVGPAEWQAAFDAQSGAVVNLGLWDPFYELTFGGHAYAEASRALVSLRTGAELVALTQPAAVLFQDGEPPGQWLAGLHLGGTVRDVEVFGYRAGENVLLTLADPLRQTDRVRLVLEDPGQSPLAGQAEVAFGFAAGPGTPPSLSLHLPAGATGARLVVRFAGGAGAAIPLGPEGLLLDQAVAHGVTLERME
jgi:hypothetical protein